MDELPWTEHYWGNNPPENLTLSVYHCAVCGKKSQLIDNVTKLGSTAANTFIYFHQQCGREMRIIVDGVCAGGQIDWTPERLVEVRDYLYQQLDQ